MTYIELKNRTFYTETSIDMIDNILNHTGFITVINRETEKKVIVTVENLLFADEV